MFIYRSCRSCDPLFSILCACEKEKASGHDRLFVRLSVFLVTVAGAVVVDFVIARLSPVFGRIPSSSLRSTECSSRSSSGLPGRCG